MFPFDMRAESTNANSANITWTAGANETSWAYVYGMYPLNVDAIIPDTATSNTITLSDLNINSHYQMAVHAICDEGYSSWSEILDFWTTTTPAEIPYTQTFEDGDADLDNWVLFNGNQPNYFTYGNVLAPPLAKP
jgi:hypothetical protein